jgi:histidinol phosphatase-like PHP family hydrolase
LKKEFAAQKYDILGHCSMLPPLAAGKPEEHFPEWWEGELVDLLLKHGVAMEISNRWKTPYDRLMEKTLKAGVMFSIGSDGHDKKTTCVLDYPRTMIERFGVKEDRIFDIERKIESQVN